MNASDELKVFYKFRRYEDGTAKDDLSRERVNDILFRDRLFFASIASLNDPFEGKPRVVPVEGDPMEQKKRLREFYVYSRVLSALTDDKPPVSGQRIFAAYESLDVSTLQKEFEEILDEHIRVYSVTAVRHPILLWSHYAGDHKGVALHFRRDVHPFTNAVPIRYSSEYPKLPFPLQGGLSTAVVDAILTKSECWAYEREHRLIRRRDIDLPDEVKRDLGWPKDRAKASHLGVPWEGPEAVAPRDALCGITLGAAMDKGVAAGLVAKIRKERPTLEIWKARRDPDKYRLVFDLVQ
jgi:hypothetical protein